MPMETATPLTSTMGTPTGGATHLLTAGGLIGTVASAHDVWGANSNLAWSSGPYDPPVFLFLGYMVSVRFSRLVAGRSSVATLEVENAVLRHQPAVLRRKGSSARLFGSGTRRSRGCQPLAPEERWSSFLVFKGRRSDVESV